MPSQFFNNAALVYSYWQSNKDFAGRSGMLSQHLTETKEFRR